MRFHYLCRGPGPMTDFMRRLCRNAPGGASVMSKSVMSKSVVSRGVMSNVLAPHKNVPFAQSWNVPF